MELTVRAATTAELPELMQLYTNARAFMQTHGNPTQWHAGYPGEARLAAEIERGVCHVVMGEETIQAVFCLPATTPPTITSRTVPGPRMYPTRRSIVWRQRGTWAASGACACSGVYSRACRYAPIPTPITPICSIRWKPAALCAAGQFTPRTARQGGRTTITQYKQQRPAFPV